MRGDAIASLLSGVHVLLPDAWGWVHEHKHRLEDLQ